MKLIAKTNNQFKNTLLHNTEIPLHRIYSKTEENESNSKINNDEIDFNLNYLFLDDKESTKDITIDSIQIVDKSTLIFNIPSKNIPKIYNITDIKAKNNNKTKNTLQITPKNKFTFNEKIFETIKPNIIEKLLYINSTTRMWKQSNQSDGHYEYSFTDITKYNNDYKTLKMIYLPFKNNRFIFELSKDLKYKYLNKLDTMDDLYITNLFSNFDQKIIDDLYKNIILCRNITCFKFPDQIEKKIIDINKKDLYLIGFDYFKKFENIEPYAGLYSISTPWFNDISFQSGKKKQQILS